MKPSDYSLLAPGPVNLHPEVLKILSLPMIHHRTPQFDQILKRTLLNIKKIFQTEQEVYLHTSTGSGGMESLLVNTLSPGDQVLAIVSGKFGERWAQMAEVFGAQVTTLNIPWGEALDPQAVEKHLRAYPQTRLVLTQACETSTGVCHPIRELGQVVAKHSALLLVDGITALGAYPLPMDEWHIDGLVGGSQKAFMLPTGLSFVCFSKKAGPVVEAARVPRFYFDVRKERKANQSGETFFSSSVSLIRALDFVLQLILQKGLDHHFQEIHRRAEMTRHFAGISGLSLFAKCPSDSLSALLLPEKVDGQRIRLELEQQFGITVMGGQDQAKGKILRVGHMGHIRDEEMLHLFESLSSLLKVHAPDHSIAPATIVTQMKQWLEQHP